MDNLDNFLNKANSQMKVKKQEDNKNKKGRDHAHQWNIMNI